MRLAVCATCGGPIVRYEGREDWQHRHPAFIVTHGAHVASPTKKEPS